MKKIFQISLLVIFVLLVSACSDRKFYDDKINVIFYSGKNATPVETIYGLEPYSKISKPDDPTRVGFDFVGWYIEASYKTEWDFDTDNVGDRSFTLFAKWDAIEYTITYVLNGGAPLTGNYPQVFSLATANLISLPANVKQTGYTFVGWFLYDWKNEQGVIQTKPGDRGHTRIPAGMAQDLVLYAHWKAIDSVVSFEINFPSEEGAPVAPDSVTVIYGTIISFVQPEAEGYNFLGWNTKADGTGDYLINGTLFTRTQRTKLYAIWEKINN